jgi:NYN domain
MRTYVYIDGFNLYYGCVKGTPYKWLNIVDLCRRLMPENDIQRVHYFTARVKSPADDPTMHTRQQAFIRALETLPEVQVTYGSFLATRKKMPLAPPRPGRSDDQAPAIVTLKPGGPTGAIVLNTEEKGSDVNIATTLVADAFRKRFEVAAVLSVDSDLALPISLVTTELRLKVGVLFPRHRYSARLANIATFRKTIDKTDLRACQFRDEVTDAHGRTIKRPAEWA